MAKAVFWCASIDYTKSIAHGVNENDRKIAAYCLNSTRARSAH